MDELDRVLFEGMLYAMEGKSPSKAIEDSERRGTINMARASRLPKKMNDVGVPLEIRRKGTTDDMSFDERYRISMKNNLEYTRAQYEKMGIKILDEYDDLFFNVELPEGWEMKPTDHSMWNEVYDNKGRRRIQYFYKAAFYDRDAFTNFDCRYGFRVEPFDRYKTEATYEERKFKPWSVYILDSGEEFLTLDSFTPRNDEEYFEVQEKLSAIGREYMEENFPEWQDINAYWDD